MTYEEMEDLRAFAYARYVMEAQAAGAEHNPAYQPTEVEYAILWHERQSEYGSRNDLR